MHKARAALSGLRAQWAAAWPLVPHSRTLERPTLGSVQSFCADGNANVRYIHTTSRYELTSAPFSATHCSLTYNGQ